MIIDSTVEKFADALVRVGEASIIGSVATLFVETVEKPFSFLGIVIGISLVILGLVVNNSRDRRK